jgi:uncharacterized coiled-coil protein SlyX
MSPIGRVFIVLNLLLAGTFVGFAGNYLQRQHNWKTAHDTEKERAAAKEAELEARVAELTGKVTDGTRQIQSLDLDLANTKNELNRQIDENKRLDGKLSSMEADYKGINSSLNGMRTEVTAAFTQAKEAMDRAIAAEATKDSAVREKDDAVAKLATAEHEIRGLKDTISNKDIAIAGLNKDKGELELLRDVARARGFLDSMATPALAGTVSVVNGKLCTINVTDNPANAEIKPGYKFAIWDASGYKGEARVTEVDGSKNIAFCTLEITKGEIKMGDKASTQTN